MQAYLDNSATTVCEPGVVEKAESLGVKPVTLGKRILRTETAGLTTLSILMYLLEES